MHSRHGTSVNFSLGKIAPILMLPVAGWSWHEPSEGVYMSSHRGCAPRIPRATDDFTGPMDETSLLPNFLKSITFLTYCEG